MQSYASNEAFVAEIQKRYALFDKEFDAISEDEKNQRFDGVDRTPQEMIAYQLGWLTLVMSWENDELAGKTVVTPTLTINGINWDCFIKIFIVDTAIIH